jgi:hypothetical protein
VRQLLPGIGRLPCFCWIVGLGHLLNHQSRRNLHRGHPGWDTRRRIPLASISFSCGSTARNWPVSSASRTAAQLTLKIAPSHAQLPSGPALKAPAVKPSLARDGAGNLQCSVGQFDGCSACPAAWPARVGSTRRGRPRNRARANLQPHCDKHAIVDRIRLVQLLVPFLHCGWRYAERELDARWARDGRTVMPCNPGTPRPQGEHAPSARLNRTTGNAHFQFVQLRVAHQP